MVDISKFNDIDSPLHRIHLLSEKLSSYESQELLKKPEWGAVNFENARKEIRIILSVSGALKALPLAELSTSQIDAILDRLTASAKVFQAIEQFSIDEEAIAPKKRRDDLVSEVTDAANGLLHVAAPVIGYLAFVTGNAAKADELTKQEFQRLKVLLTEAEDFAAKKQREVEEILAATREASVSTGVAKFTQGFENKARDLERQCTRWLLMTAALAAITISEIFFPTKYFSLMDNHSISWVIAQAMLTKAALIGISLTATVWCGTIYRALAHQAAVNKHRALSLQTFQTFTEATDNQQTKDAVLLAATEAAFGYSSTGLIGSDQKQPNPGSMITVGNLPKGGTSVMAETS